MAKVSQIERNIVLALCNKNHLTPKRVRNTRLIEHVWVSAGAVAYDDARTVDEGNHVLNDCRVLPNVVRPPATKASIASAKLDGGIDIIESRIERHHH